MAVRVVADLVPLGGDAPNGGRLTLGIHADAEEGRMDALLLQHIEDLPGVRVVRPIIEGQRDNLLGARPVRVDVAEELRRRRPRRITAISRAARARRAPSPTRSAPSASAAHASGARRCWVRTVMWRGMVTPPPAPSRHGRGEGVIAYASPTAPPSLRGEGGRGVRAARDAKAARHRSTYRCAGSR